MKTKKCNLLGKKSCRLCGGKKFKEIINFGKFPLVNHLTNKEDLDKKDPVYPLKLVQCQKCHLVQLDNPIDVDKIYRNTDYLYYSSDIPKVVGYFEDLANDIKERFMRASGEFVVEIASNDGVFLKNFDNCLGIDPASNVVLRSLKNGHPAISDYFTKRLAQNIKRYFGQAQVIMGANFIAHLDDTNDVMEGIKLLLEDNGVAILECNYWGSMVKNKNCALIYHDHFSYFTLQNWIEYAQKFDMQVFDAEVTWAQDGTLRIFLGKNKRQVTQRCIGLFKQEEADKLNTLKTAQQHAENIRDGAERLKVLMNRLKKEGATIAGYGAAAKGFPVMKLAGIGAEHLDYFVDDSPAKWGKYTPVTHIPVVKRDEIEKDPDYFFIAASNYEDVIVAKEQEYLKQGGKFITTDARIIAK